MRQISQPGPADDHSLQSAPCLGRHFKLTLQPGQTLIEAIRRGFAEAGFTSGTVRMDGVTLSPFAYVMPALATTTQHAAYYSETFRPSGAATVETGAMTFGQRDGAPFFHCHALWTEADGTRRGGHILPDETTVASEITLDAIGLDGAAFVAEQDEETLFKLFVPKAADPRGGASEGRFVAIRVKPNAELFHALEALCAQQGIAKAIIHGGVGSTIGARFTDGRTVENFATEVAITRGTIDADGAGSEIEVALIDYTGAMAQGALLRGDNPVLMTFELVLEVQ